MSNIQKHLAMLGLKVRDRVTSVEGVVTSVSFDLYGCVMGTINRGLDKDGKQFDQCWYDIARLQVLSDMPVMERPDFLGNSPQAQGLQGCESKSAPHSA